MPYRIAGIDVHKKMLAVVVADVEIDGDFHFDRQKVGTTPADLRGLADWLVEQDVEEVVMESTAQYGGRCGKRWNSIGGPDAGRATVRRGSRARCISPKRNRIVGCGSPKFRPAANYLADVSTADQTRTSRLTMTVVPIANRRPATVSRGR
jgi:hypothetical protein